MSSGANAPREAAAAFACGADGLVRCKVSSTAGVSRFAHAKLFDFTWAAVQGADYYQVLESAALGDPYVQLGGDVVGESVSFEMALHFRWQASDVLRACNAAGCTESAGDGDTLAVEAPYEDSNATGISGNQLDDSAVDSGAVYLY